MPKIVTPSPEPGQAGLAGAIGVAPEPDVAASLEDAIEDAWARSGSWSMVIPERGRRQEGS